MFQKPRVCFICETPAHIELFFLWQPSLLVFLSPWMLSIDNFPYLFVFISTTLPRSLSVIPPPFLLHPSRTLFKERTSGSSCSQDKRVITLPLLGKPALPNSFEVFRSHILNTQGLYNTVKIMTEAYSIHKNGKYYRN